MTLVERILEKNQFNFPIECDYFGHLGDLWIFEDLSLDKQMELLIRRGIFRNCSLISPDKICGSNLEIENNIELNSIDFFKTIYYKNSRYILDPVIKDQMWDEFYSSHHRHKFEERTIKDIDTKLRRFKKTQDRLQFLYERMDLLDIFNLQNIEIEICRENNEIFFHGLQEHIKQNFTSKRCLDFLTMMLGQNVEIYNKVEKQISNDIAKFRVYKYLERLVEKETRDPKDIRVNSETQFDTFESVYMLEQLGVFVQLERLGFNKSQSYNLISQLIGRNKQNIKSNYLKIGKYSLPEKLESKALKINSLLNM